MKLFEETLSSEIIYEGKIFDVKKDSAKLENGAIALREFVQHSGGVCVVAITDDNEVLLVRQYRYARQQVLLEIPAGKLNKGEDHCECGKRELLEETGYISHNYRFLTEFYPSPAYVSEVDYIYMATDLELKEQKLDDDEFLEVEKIPLDQAVKMILSGEIKDGKTQSGILMAKMILEKQDSEKNPLNPKTY